MKLIILMMVVCLLLLLVTKLPNRSIIKYVAVAGLFFINPIVFCLGAAIIYVSRHRKDFTV